jgi:hypothetical protein
MKLLTKKEIIEKVNRTINLRKKLKKGSWDYYAPRAGVFPIHDEPTSNPNMRRFLYAAWAVKAITNLIGYNYKIKKGGNNNVRGTHKSGKSN